MRIPHKNKSSDTAVLIDPRIIKLPSGKEITLNDQQFEALNRMEEWLDTKEDYFFTLSSYAGSGKTTCVHEIISSVS